MIVVADSSPLIFLSKINRLDLLTNLYDEIFVPEQVHAELLVKGVPPDESYILKKFLDSCLIMPIVKIMSSTKGLSLADRAALTLAIDRQADRLIADERLLRRIALAEGIASTGTIGVLFLAKQNRLISADEAQNDLKTLVKHHCFRISISVFETAMEKFQDKARNRTKIGNDGP